MWRWCWLLLLIELNVQAGSEHLPEADSGRQPVHAVTSTRQMAVTANPYATQAALSILAKGGTALDAAVAAQLVLGLVEPQSSGLGGGAFLLYFDGQKLHSWDGREKAPQVAIPQRFLDENGSPRPFLEAVWNGLSIGVPGVPHLLEETHRRYGRLPWKTLTAPAIHLAQQGFIVSPRLHLLIANDPLLAKDPGARHYFYDEEGNPRPAGYRLRNPAYAKTLHALSRQGMGTFYGGHIAEDIVKAAAERGSDLALQDLKDYRSLERPPLCRDFRQWKVCSIGPPSSGGIGVLQMLGILNPLPLTDWQPVGLPYVHWFAEAGRLVYADRSHYIGDSDFTPVPVEGLLDTHYLDERRALLSPDHSVGIALPGHPTDTSDIPVKPSYEEHGTSQLVMVDKEGHWLSMTSSIEDTFGDRLMVDGFLLNNQLTDFDAIPAESANSAAGSKRPRSSMAPVIVFDHHASAQPILAAGSPGGSQIINYVAQTLLAALIWRLPPGEVVSQPHFGNRNGPTELEKGTMLAQLQPALEQLRHPVRLLDLNSGIALVMRQSALLTGVADPRREGCAAGKTTERCLPHSP